MKESPEGLSQTGECLHSILMLASSLTSRRYESGGKMNETDGRIGGVLMLAPFAPGTEGLDSALA